MSIHREAPSEGEDPDVLRASGQRIETLLEALSSGGTVARERAEELVRLVTELYGEGLARILAVLEQRGEPGRDALRDLVADDLVASLLIVHGLHPEDVRTRVEAALESVRPYLGTHGGDVELLEVTDEGVVRLQLLGSCDGCPSSSATLELAVEGAIEAAAPEVWSVEVVAPEQGEGAAPALIPVSALRARLAAHDEARGHWEEAPELGELGDGEVGGFRVAGTSLLVCRVGPDLFAFADDCAACDGTLAGARLGRRAGAPVGSAVLTCPLCQAHYDVRAAGAGVEETVGHLEPFPVLRRDGVLSVAVPTAPEPVPT